MGDGIKRPKWTARATIGLIFIVTLIVILVLIITEIVPESEKKVIPQVSRINISLTSAQQEEIIGLALPVAETETEGFYSVKDANPSSLTDAAILHILSNNEKLRLGDDGNFILTDAEVAAELESMFGFRADSFDGYESERFVHDEEASLFYAYSGYSDEELAGFGFIDYGILESTVAGVSEVPEKTEILADVMPDLVFSEKSISILSAWREDDEVVADILVEDGDSERKLEITLRDNGGYVLVSMIDI